jgi:hypothetical protein
MTAAPTNPLTGVPYYRQPPSSCPMPPQRDRCRSLALFPPAPLGLHHAAPPRPPRVGILV